MELALQLLPYIDSVSAMAVLGLVFLWMRYADKDKKINSSLENRVDKIEEELKLCNQDKQAIADDLANIKTQYAVLLEKHAALQIELEKMRTELKLATKARYVG